MSASYQEALGERLRSIRTQQGLTLQQVEERSAGTWKAVVIGSYERGDRAVSVSKLAQLAQFYGVPVGELLPVRDDAGTSSVSAPDSGKVMVDLTRLGNAEFDPELTSLSRYVTTIQVQRGDYNGRVLTLRREDVRALATVSGSDPDEFLIDLTERGVLMAATS